MLAYLPALLAASEAGKATTPALWAAMTFLLALTTVIAGAFAGYKSKQVTKANELAALAERTAAQWKSVADARESAALAWKSEMDAANLRMDRIEQEAMEAKSEAISAKATLKVLIDANVGPEIGHQILTRFDDIRQVQIAAMNELLEEFKKQNKKTAPRKRQNPSE